MIDLKGKKAVVFGGATGLLGQALVRQLQEQDVTTVGYSSADMDILDQKTVEKILDRETPDFIFNAVAYTQVDQAEEDEEMAFALNATVPALIAAQAARRNIPFIHFSTDFVFKGNSNVPYQETDRPNAISVYGISKAAGEKGLLELGYPKTLIIRISWLFGPDKTNFVDKILNLAREREQLNVVNDQTGSPSYTPDIARNTLELVRRGKTGIYHLCNSGSATWFDLAATAVKMAEIPCAVEPVPTSAYPTKAARPAYSVLDLSAFRQATGITPRHWRDALEEYVTVLKS
ncbi:dTDP-4-dehydrorhamnose reductase [Salidesulfovibrio onnuriiensis]|uniref:dTDP-4-dehydrorhamnose reductase n=1 Tax=Salidesulfovibrio onnuriiensis TaxID=2583823 RepID=UPI0011CA0891|nr:dTDP-4-dehydrorhamnose reductase [Salidesulfovibrio onnuriiensis]